MSFKIAATVIAIGTTVSAYGQYQQGKFQEESAKRQAEIEKLRAQNEELARREELNATLAANQNALILSGISGATPQSIALQSARQVSTSESVIGLSERLKQRQLVREGEAAAFAGRYGAASTLLQGAGKIATMKEM